MFYISNFILSLTTFSSKTKVDYKILEGEASDVICKTADKGNFDLIVMGTQGATGLSKVFFGSTTNNILKNTTIPVLAIPSHCIFKPIKVIAFSVDNKAISSVYVVCSLLFLANSYQAKIQIYHAGKYNQGQTAMVEVNRLLKGLDTNYYHEISTEPLNKKINDFAKSTHADLFCMVRRNQRFLDKIFQASTTSKQAFDSPVPLLVLQDR